MSQAPSAVNTGGIQRTNAVAMAPTPAQNATQPPGTHSREARGDQENRGLKRKAQQFDEPMLKKARHDKLNEGHVPAFNKEPRQAALIAAARLEHVTTLQTLYPKPAEPDLFGHVLLIAAAETGRLDAVNHLISHGLNINEQDKYGRTALHYAYARGHALVAAALVDAGAAREVRDDLGNTPLMLAAANDQTEILKHYRYTLTSLREFNKEGDHALAIAARNSSHGAMEILIRKGFQAVYELCNQIEDVLAIDLLFCPPLFYGNGTPGFQVWRANTSGWRQDNLLTFCPSKIKNGRAQCIIKGHILGLTASLLEPDLLRYHALALQIAGGSGRESEGKAGREAQAPAKLAEASYQPWFLARLLSDLPGTAAVEKKIQDSTLSAELKRSLVQIVCEEYEAIQVAIRNELNGFTQTLAGELRPLVLNNPVTAELDVEIPSPDLEKFRLLPPVEELLQNLIVQTWQEQAAISPEDFNSSASKSSLKHYEIWLKLASKVKQWNEVQLASNSLVNALCPDRALPVEFADALFAQWKAACEVFGLELAKPES